MSYIYRLAGENLDLAEAELNGFLASQEVEEECIRDGRIALTESHPDQLKRLALTHEVCEKCSESEKPEELQAEVEGESFAVRTEDVPDNQFEDLESVVGKKLQSKDTRVELDDPDEVFKVYFMNEKLLLGKVVEDIDRGLFNKRKNQNRPFSSPISLDPVLARVLVNLSGAKPGECLLDPFCGTGGILIEAGLCGIGVYGLDVDEEMVQGTRENLDQYGIISRDIKQGDVSESLQKFPEARIMVTDLPYGKSSGTEGDIEEKFTDLIDEFEGTIIFMYDSPNLGNLEHKFELYVHSELTRYIYCIESGP